MKRRLLISFSGGETSAYMTKIIFDKMAGRYDEIQTVFANTGEERNETLDFADRCDKTWGWNLIWVEASVRDGRVASKARVVNYGTASRHGEPFEAVIAKYGIPNKSYPHCTRELKMNPIHSYIREQVGWPSGTYETAIGIRVDEFDRQHPEAKKQRFIYPLINPFPTNKPQVNEFWQNNGWRLNLKGYEGNCKWCWKKSLRKHLTIIKENPSAYEFPERMERLYATAGAGDGQRKFFRKYMTVADLRALAQRDFIPANDDARQYQVEMFSDLDIGEACEESCEIDFSGEAA